MQCIAVEPKAEIERAIRHMEYVLYGAPFAHLVVVSKLLHKVILRLPAHLHGHNRACTAIIFGDDAHALLNDF